MQLTSEQKQFIFAHEHENVRETALRFKRDDMPMLLAQIAGRQIAEKKIPSWYAVDDIFYPPHLSLEQSSSELTARYKASLLSGIVEGFPLKADNQGRTFADLTGGMGVDFSFLSPYFKKAAYIEKDEQLCKIAAHNFGVLGLKNATIHCADAGTFLSETPPLDCIYLDPSRRDNAGRKVFRIEDCTPNVLEIKPLLLEKSRFVMVKYSPMLDIALAVKSLGCVNAVHVVSVDNECKELIFLLSKEAVDEPLFSTVNLKKTGEKELFLFTMLQERACRVSFALEPGRYLYEPNASILKAGAFKMVAKAYSLQKLHVSSHLYTSETLVPDFPGRVFEVDTFFVPNKKNLAVFLQQTKKANIAVRNYPMSVAEIRRKTGLAEGGDTYLFATTLHDEQKVWVICRRI